MLLFDVVEILLKATNLGLAPNVFQTLFALLLFWFILLPSRTLFLQIFLELILRRKAKPADQE
jgi:hypothetical protein